MITKAPNRNGLVCISFMRGASAKTQKRHDPIDAQGETPSKSARKRAMHELQDLGEALVALDPARVAALDLPERLADAIGEARTITKHEARRRQLQFIGRLMRDVDAQSIKNALAQWRRGATLAAHGDRDKSQGPEHG